MPGERVGPIAHFAARVARTSGSRHLTQDKPGPPWMRGMIFRTLMAGGATMSDGYTEDLQRALQNQIINPIVMDGTDGLRAWAHAGAATVTAWPEPAIPDPLAQLVGKCVELGPGVKGGKTKNKKKKR
jgi:hypothetical protein